MGVVSGLTLFHNQLTEDANFPFSNKLESEPFTLDELYPILKTALAKDNEYELNKLSDDTLELKEIVTGESVHNWGTFHVAIVEQKDICIKTEFCNSLLYELLSYYAVLGHKVHIDWNGIHPFYSPETFSNYKEGHYHYACTVFANELYDYIKGIINNFKGYNDYWELTIFHDNLEVNINNHYSEIYEDDNYAEKESFGISINNLQQTLDIVNKATSEDDGNYYFQKLNTDSTLKIINATIKELIDSGTEYFLTAFNPAMQSYYEVKAYIKNVNLKDVAELIESSHINIKGNKVEFIKKQIDDNSAIISGIYKEKNIGYSEVIKKEDILKGHIYLGKMYGEYLFETIQRTIAQNFCTCYIQSEDYPMELYYKNTNDKNIIEAYFKSFEGYEDWLEGFVKV